LARFDCFAVALRCVRSGGWLRGDAGLPVGSRSACRAQAADAPAIVIPGKRGVRRHQLTMRPIASWRAMGSRRPANVTPNIIVAARILQRAVRGLLLPGEGQPATAQEMSVAVGNCPPSDELQPMESRGRIRFLQTNPIASLW